MKTKFLLPHRFKRLGWILFVPALVLAAFQFFGNLEPEWLDWPVPKFFHRDIVLGQHEAPAQAFVEFETNNVADELVSALLLVTCMLLVFGRERDEDEFVMKLRLESILWAALLNGLLVLAAILLTYDFAFFYVMVFNLFLLFLLFIARFHWVLYKFRKEAVE